MAAPTNSFLIRNPNLPPSTKPVSIGCASTTVKSDPPRVFNLAAGPAALPENVLLKAQSDLYNCRGSGMSVMEMSHRGKEFLSIIQKAESDLRRLLDIPPEYSATTQFAALPLDPVDYVVTGSWGDEAFKEALKYCNPKAKCSKHFASGRRRFREDSDSSDTTFDELEQNPHAKCLHICANETIHGVEFKDYPNGLLIADMSSNFCSKPVDVSRFGVMCAEECRSFGCIIRKDLIGKARDVTLITRFMMRTVPCTTRLPVFRGIHV
ncbi:unnamed protein product [Brassica rapa subsp. trilocularis]